MSQASLRRGFVLICLGLLGAGLRLSGQTISTIPQFPLDTNPLVIRERAQPNRPFSVVGERGAILGQQDGTFEMWLLPVKLLHHAHLTAKLENYDAVIDLNEFASQITVRPDHTTITYAHPAIEVKQHMFVARAAQSGIATAVVLFEIHSIRKAEITLSFDPAMERQWPAPNFGRPNGSWIGMGDGGGYLLETDNPNFFGMIVMPQSTHGLLRPYQERPKTEPLEFHIHFDPAHDEGRFFPLVAAITGVSGKPEMTRPALESKLLEAAQNVPALYRSTAEYYRHFFDTRLTVDSPDPKLNDALRWAEVSIEQAKVVSPQGTGLAGGWFTSGDSARPGFGWFFGRDTLWSLYAVNSYGDFALSREAMDFLLAHQRADGKMMHEYSQTADLVDWTSLPYLYAAADSTPLFVMQMEDYVRSSGDVAYLKAHWDNVKRAYAFTRAHTTNSVYDNSQGTGWVEEWVPKLPQQEIYLAALDQQSSAAMSRLAHLMNDTTLAEEAAKQADHIRAYLQTYRRPDGFYNFSRNRDGSFDTEETVFPAVAWWSGHLQLPDAGPMLREWAGQRFSTDWGMRSMAEGETTYDPMSYHHGSVWPLYTGWESLAQYRAGRPLAGYASLRQNIDLTWLQDPGAVTEVLSGAFYQPLGRSSSHQLWSSAMTFTPAIRGLFGIEANALAGTLRVAPQLPADWDKAALHHIPFGNTMLDLNFTRQKGRLMIEATSAQPTKLCLVSSTEFFSGKPCTQPAATVHRISLALPPVEVALVSAQAEQGQPTSQWKVLGHSDSEHALHLTLEGPAGSTQRLLLRNNSAKGEIRVQGATREGEALLVTAPAGQGYTQQQVILNW